MTEPNQAGITILIFCILLTLLALGIQNIYIGPSLPAFLSPNVLNILVAKFNLHPITTPENDLRAILK